MIEKKYRVKVRYVMVRQLVNKQLHTSKRETPKLRQMTSSGWSTSVKDGW
jgi:hypothetical protein